MRFTRLAIEGVQRIEIDPVADERGVFARLWCRDEFARAGIPIDVVQASVSVNRRAGTLRGLHFAWPPAAEGKVVRCARGRLVDVILDLRPASPDYLRHVAVELDAADHAALYLPPGVAHGFQSLVDDTEVHYMMSEAYRPECAAGVRPDDPAFGIRWPLPVTCISARDRDAAQFDDAVHRRQFAVGVQKAGDAA